MDPRFFSLILVILLAASPVSAAPAQKLNVVASFSILGDMVHVVGGDDIVLTTLVGAGGDAHEYEPTPADAKTLATADIVIVNGLGFEGWLDRLVVSSGYKGEVVVATKNIQPLTSIAEDHHGQDPHAWQNVANAKIYVANIEAALSAKDPAHAADYKKNAAAYIATLDVLDVWVRAQIASVPAAKRKVITTHDAFQYFAKAYGVAFLSPQGMSTETQASAADVAKLIDQIRAEKITALFFENMTDSRLMTQLQKDGGATIGGTLYSDALSPASGPANNYVDMVKYNVPLLVAAMKHNPAQ